MNRLLLTFLVVLFTGGFAFGQTTATDFTAADCSSVSHSLFTELNAGKVVVLVWVMPCGSCISDAKAGYDAVQGFAISNPGKVLYWMADDAGNTLCPSLASWATTNSIGPSNMTTFPNTGNAIDESNYGGIGMPHVVVMGGTDHHIYYNQKNGSNDGVAIANAITQALNTTGVAHTGNGRSDMSIYPNPARSRITVEYRLEQYTNVTIEVFNVIGSKVKAVLQSEQAAGSHSVDVNFENNFPKGIYFVKINTGTTSQSVKFTIVD
jgi:Secretion system C-terminal sorting domain